KTVVVGLKGWGGENNRYESNGVSHLLVRLDSGGLLGFPAPAEPYSSVRPAQSRENARCQPTRGHALVRNGDAIGNNDESRHNFRFPSDGLARSAAVSSPSAILLRRLRLLDYRAWHLRVASSAPYSTKDSSYADIG